jgi:hypothetical protein
VVERAAERAAAGLVAGSEAGSEAVGTVEEREAGSAVVGSGVGLAVAPAEGWAAGCLGSARAPRGRWRRGARAGAGRSETSLLVRCARSLGCQRAAGQRSLCRTCTVDLLSLFLCSLFPFFSFFLPIIKSRVPTPRIPIAPCRPMDRLRLSLDLRLSKDFVMDFINQRR